MSNAYQSDTQEVTENGIYVIPDKSLDDNHDDDVVVVSKRSVKNDDDDDDDETVNAIPVLSKGEEARTSVEDKYASSTDKSTANTAAFNNCLSVPELGRFVPSGRAFQVQYVLRIGSIPFPTHIMVRDTSPIVIKFAVKQNIDIGGTLKFDLAVIKESLVSFQKPYTVFFSSWLLVIFSAL